MATEFITNRQKLLSDVVNNILPASKSLYFLVGYFYFSGFEEIYKNVSDKTLKVLVGLEIEHALANKVKEFEIVQEVKTSRGALRESFNSSLVQLFNDTDFFDTPRKREAFHIFLEKIKDGTLEIRKTLQPNHAKLYIFENDEEHNHGGEFPGSVITGSSNLTRSGLRDRFEINVISRDGANYKEAYTIFKQLWDDAVVIVDKHRISDFLYNVVERIWIDKLPKPFLMYIRVLEEYFSVKEHDHLRLPGEITREKFINLKYQIDAVRKSLDIIHRHKGVIIADVVGLGKSIIASAIAHNLNLRTIIIAPPHLKSQWEDYCFDFDYTAKIYTSGKIEKALEDNDQTEQKLVIIDEAHKYRNELTADYANLHKLCQRNKVILLSATPFNNRPQDVFSMVKLFQLPTRSTIQTIDNLSFQFKKLIAEYKQIGKIQKAKKESINAINARIRNVADQIRNILSPLVIRRSRLDLKAIEEYWDDLEAQNIDFPNVNEPKLLDYDLGNLSELYEETLEKIAPEDEDEEGFLGARYKPTAYIKDFEKYRKEIAEEMGVDKNLLKQSQVNLADFMKRLLVRRFESSILAFRSTLENIINSSKVVLDWYEKFGKVPIYKKGQIPDVDSLVESTGEDLDEELSEAVLDEQLQSYVEKGLWYIDKKEIRKQFAVDIRRDIELLTEIHKAWFEDGVPEDPKLGSFAEILETKLKEKSNRKIVVFSEFADTANYISEKLGGRFRIFKYTAKDATKTNKEIIRQNFDAGYKTQVNDYDVLIATDAISEGYNLHRAGIVFNYDIPYNPTRVIQRVGRINRINKKVFDELFIYNFFPSATGERETRVKQISTLKIAMVHALFGEDTKVLTKDEQLQSFFAEQFKRAMSDQEELSPEAKYENFIRKLRTSKSEIVEEALSLPKRCRICRSVSKNKPGVLVFGKKGEEFAFKFGSKTQQPTNLPIAEALALFEADVSEKPKPTTDSFEKIYEDIKEKLFSRKTEIAMDRGKQETINKVDALKSKCPQKKDYLEDLSYVVKELDALPERFGRFIRSIEIENLQEHIQQLQQQVPHSYLSGIIDRERQIEEGKESLILSEELL